MEYEFAPESEIQQQILASADPITAETEWEPWRREAYPDGELWYRRRIEGSEGTPKILGVADDDLIEAEEREAPDCELYADDGNGNLTIIATGTAPKLYITGGEVRFDV